MRTAKLGEYRYPVLIRTRTLAAKDALGEEVESWADDTRTWFAKREWLSSATSTVDNGLRSSEKRVRLTIHGLPTVAITDQIKLKTSGEIFTIDSVLTNDYETIIEGTEGVE